MNEEQLAALLFCRTFYPNLWLSLDECVKRFQAYIPASVEVWKLRAREYMSQAHGKLDVGYMTMEEKMDRCSVCKALLAGYKGGRCPNKHGG